MQKRPDSSHVVTAEASILGKEGFKDADTAATLASLKHSSGHVKAVGRILSPEDAEQVIEMAKRIDANRRT